MSGATYKKEIGEVDGTPEKRLFLSIISDYDLKTGLCELIDNALDLWITNDKKRKLHIEVELSAERQLISVSDNAGGLPENQLRLLISPGATRNKLDQEVIGIFGVGGKRAGVALGELIEIRTRHKKQKSFQIDINNEWLSSDDWHLAAYEIPEIDAETTTVEISKLRQRFDVEDVEDIRVHLGETYQWFIHEGCTISLNGKAIKPLSFEIWAYPRGYQPRQAVFEITPTGHGKLTVTITAGLVRDRDPQRDNYGVYVYCNHRLIVKELRTRDVGYFITGEAGVPHPDASLCRVIVDFQGSAELMPWNSSKSGLNFSHPAFTQVRPTLIELVSYFSRLSRRLKNDWDNRVFKSRSGKIRTIDSSEVLSNSKIILPVLPRGQKPPHIEDLKTRNKKILDQKPWTLGLVEAMGLVELIAKQKLDTKNRAALILLDSNFEIGLKEFIVSRTDLFPPHTYNDTKIVQLFKSRHLVLKEVTAHVSLKPTLLSKVAYYYNLRNKLIHERATVLITDNQVKDYRKIVEQVLKMLFDLNFPSD